MNIVHHSSTHSVLTNTLNPDGVKRSKHFETWGEVKRSNIVLLKVVMLHIKLKGMEHRVPCKHIVCPNTYPQPTDGAKRSNHFIAENSHVAYQIKGNGTQGIIQVHILSLHTPSTYGWVQINFVLKVVMLRIKLMGMKHTTPCKHEFCPYKHPNP